MAEPKTKTEAKGVETPEGMKIIDNTNAERPADVQAEASVTEEYLPSITRVDYV